MIVFFIVVLFWCLCSEVDSNIVHMDLVVEFHVNPVLWLDAESRDVVCSRCIAFRFMCYHKVDWECFVAMVPKLRWNSFRLEEPRESSIVSHRYCGTDFKSQQDVSDLTSHRR